MPKLRGNRYLMHMEILCIVSTQACHSYLFGVKGQFFLMLQNTMLYF